jgi:hypothetical protein
LIEPASKVFVGLPVELPITLILSNVPANAIAPPLTFPVSPLTPTQLLAIQVFPVRLVIVVSPVFVQAALLIVVPKNPTVEVTPAVPCDPALEYPETTYEDATPS